MASEFDILARTIGAPMLEQQFAERTAGGELDGEAVVIEWPAGSREPVKLAGILGAEEAAETITDNGDFTAAYQRTLDVSRSELPADLTEPPLSAVIKAGGHSYKVAQTGHKFDSVWVRLTLIRKPLRQEKAMQKRS